MARSIKKILYAAGIADAGAIDAAIASAVEHGVDVLRGLVVCGAIERSEMTMVLELARLASLNIITCQEASSVIATCFLNRCGLKEAFDANAA